MARPKKDPVASGDFSEMLGLLSTGIANKKPNNYQYKPHEKQLQFHKSQKNGRQYIGGNRSGKTTGGINEDIWWLTGRHPYIKLPPPPIFGRVTTVDFKNGANKIIIPQLKQWIPPSDLINGAWEDSYDGQKHVLTLANGSQLEIMSYDQDLDKFAGVPRHFTHFDEEPPKDIWEECKARLVDYNGRWWMTMTPVEGMTWTFGEIFDKHSDIIDIVEVDIHDNTYLSKEAIETFLSGYEQDAQDIRGGGKYIALTGLVFKTYNPSVHVIPEVVPSGPDWTHYKSMDAGFNNPTAVYRHAVHKRDGYVITYDEHYRREWTVEQHAKYILERDKYFLDNYGIEYFLNIADPAIAQRSQTTGLSMQIAYANEGIMWVLGAKRDVKAGLDKMNNYFRLGKWFITQNCPQLQGELRKYKWADYATSKLKEKNNRKEEPAKKDDHGCDSCRYFYSFMPDLDVNAPTPSRIVRPNLLGAPTIRLGPKMIDHNLSKQRVHIISDEYVGEF